MNNIKISLDNVQYKNKPKGVVEIGRINNSLVSNTEYITADNIEYGGGGLTLEATRMDRESRSS